MRGSPGGRRPGSALPWLVLGAAAEQHCAGLSSSLEKPKKTPTVFLKYQEKQAACPPARGKARATGEMRRRAMSSLAPQKCHLHAGGMRTQPISRISEFDGITLSFPNTNTA